MKMSDFWDQKIPFWVNFDLLGQIWTKYQLPYLGPRIFLKNAKKAEIYSYKRPVWVKSTYLTTFSKKMTFGEKNPHFGQI